MELHEIIEDECYKMAPEDEKRWFALGDIMSALTEKRYFATGDELADFINTMDAGLVKLPDWVLFALADAFKACTEPPASVKC